MPFDFDDYEREVPLWSTPRLQAEIRKYVQQTSGASASGGVGVALAPFTLGFSLLGTGMAAATYANGLKKFTILREEMHRRDEEMKLRRRDFIVPMAFSIGTAGLTHGTGSAMHSLVHNAAQHGSQIVTNNPHMISMGEKAINGGIGQGCKQIGSRTNKTL